jgi:hypothetical protein
MSQTGGSSKPTKPALERALHTNLFLSILSSCHHSCRTFSNTILCIWNWGWTMFRDGWTVWIEAWLLRDSHHPFTDSISGNWGRSWSESINQPISQAKDYRQTSNFFPVWLRLGFDRLISNNFYRWKTAELRKCVNQKVRKKLSTDCENQWSRAKTLTPHTTVIGRACPMIQGKSIRTSLKIEKLTVANPFRRQNHNWEPPWTWKWDRKEVAGESTN